MSEETKVEATETSAEKQGSEVPSQDKPKRTEAETTAYNLRKQADKAKELGLDPADLLGLKVKVDPTLSDDEPLTVGKLRDIQKQESQNTALKMADSIEDDAERASVREILEKRIVPSGNAEADFLLARNAVNADKNARIAEEVSRRGTPTKTASGGSAATKVEDNFVPTEQEKIFMAPPYNLKKDQIIANRPKV